MTQKENYNSDNYIDTIDSKIEELEAEIEHLKKENELKTGWISLLSHNFKEAFLSFNMLLESFEDSTLNENEFFALLPRVKQDCQKNIKVINDTTTWIKTQKDGFKPQWVDLCGLDLYFLLKDEFQEILERKKLIFSFKGDVTSNIITDRILISFILRSIMDNAIKFSNLGTTILFEVTTTQDLITLSIQDQGIGMDEKQIETLFSFDSALYIGTQGEIGSGLSLKIVKNFVSLVHGNMEIESSEGNGTRISIILSNLKDKKHASGFSHFGSR